MNCVHNTLNSSHLYVYLMLLKDSEYCISIHISAISCFKRKRNNEQKLFKFGSEIISVQRGFPLSSRFLHLSLMGCYFLRFMVRHLHFTVFTETKQ